MKPYPHNELCNFIATWLHKSCLIRQYFTSQTQLCTLVWLGLTLSLSLHFLRLARSNHWIAQWYCRLLERYTKIKLIYYYNRFEFYSLSKNVFHIFSWNDWESCLVYSYHKYNWNRNILNVSWKLFTQIDEEKCWKC